MSLMRQTRQGLMLLVIEVTKIARHHPRIASVTGLAG